MKIIVIIILFLSTLFNTTPEDEQIELRQINDRAAQVVLTSFQQNAKCMAENIIYEAGNQGIRGGIAVAQVTLNRVNSHKFKNTVCGVVHQYAQFSWTKLAKKPKYDKLQYQEAWAIAVNVMQHKVALPELKDALYYHANYVKPTWRNKMIKVATIGQHIFYRNNDA